MTGSSAAQPDNKGTLANHLTAQERASNLLAADFCDGAFYDGAFCEGAFDEGAFLEDWRYDGVLGGCAASPFCSI